MRQGERWRGIFPALSEPDFRTLWLGMLPGILAMQMYFFTNGYLAFELTGSAKAIGYVSLGFGIPMLCLSLIGGMAADRYSKRLILMLSQVITALMAVLLAALVISGAIRLWHMVVVSVVMGSAFTFHIPARQAFIAEVTSPERLMNAIALNGAGLNACRVIGPPLAGWMIGMPGIKIGGVYVIMALMSAAVLPGLLPIKDRGAHAGARDTSQLAAMREGLAYIAGSPVLRVLLILSLAPIVLGLPYQALMPVFAKEIFAVGPQGLGLLMMASGGGALVGSLAIAMLRRLRHPGRVQLVLGVLFGLGLALFAFGQAYRPGLALMVFVGLVSSAYLALNATLIMDAAESRFHGRVMSVYMLTFAALPLGNMLMSAFADSLGAPLTVGGGGLLLAVTVLLSGLMSPSYRRMQYRAAIYPGDQGPGSSDDNTCPSE